MHGNEVSVGDRWSIATACSVEENIVINDLLQCADTELVCKWTCTLFKCSERRMAKRTSHPPLKPYLLEVHNKMHTTADRFSFKWIFYFATECTTDFKERS